MDVLDTELINLNILTNYNRNLSCSLLFFVNITSQNHKSDFLNFNKNSMILSILSY